MKWFLCFRLVFSFYWLEFVLFLRVVAGRSDCVVNL